MNKNLVAMLGLGLLFLLPLTSAASGIDKQDRLDCVRITKLNNGINYFTVPYRSDTYAFKSLYFDHKGIRKNITDAFNAGWFNAQGIGSLISFYDKDSGWDTVAMNGHLKQGIEYKINIAQDRLIMQSCKPHIRGKDR